MVSELQNLAGIVKFQGRILSERTKSFDKRNEILLSEATTDIDRHNTHRNGGGVAISASFYLLRCICAASKMYRNKRIPTSYGGGGEREMEKCDGKNAISCDPGTPQERGLPLWRARWRPGCRTSRYQRIPLLLAGEGNPSSARIRA